MPKATTTPGQIEIQRIGRSAAEIRVVGTAPLIANSFNSKSRQQMLDRQMGKALTRAAKDPEANFQAARYRLPDGRDGFPSTGFKAAIVDAARYFKGSKIAMTDLRRMIFVAGEGTDLLVPLELEAEPEMREDTVRNASGVADIRHRPQYWPWSATLRVIWVAASLSLGSITALVDAAGMTGVGEWRPGSKSSNSGMYGTFQLADEQDIKEVHL